MTKNNIDAIYENVSQNVKDMVDLGFYSKEEVCGVECEPWKPYIKEYVAPYVFNYEAVIREFAKDGTHILYVDGEKKIFADPERIRRAERIKCEKMNRRRKQIEKQSDITLVVLICFIIVTLVTVLCAAGYVNPMMGIFYLFIFTICVTGSYLFNLLMIKLYG